jgi:predicted porin
MRAGHDSGEAASGKLTTSYIGISGIEDLGGATHVEFSLAQFLRPDTGTNGRFNGDAFFVRDAVRGVARGLGQPALGAQHDAALRSDACIQCFR